MTPTTQDTSRYSSLFLFFLPFETASKFENSLDESKGDIDVELVAQNIEGNGGREKSGSRSKRGERERGAFFEARVQIVCNPLTKPAFVPKTLIVGQEGANRGQFHALTGQLFARD